MSNRVAMVTGAAQGIGKGIATALAAAGFRVAVADLNLTAAEQTAKEIAAAGGTAIAVEVDVTRTAVGRVGGARPSRPSSARSRSW